MKKVIVIGAGVAGLSAAVRLQKSGYNVEIFEKNPMAGGKMYRILNRGYAFDVGPTLVMSPDVYEDVYKYAGRDPKDYIEMKKLDPMYTVYFDRPDHARYDISNDFSKLMALMEKKGPETALGFLNYLAEIYKRYQVALDYFITRPFRTPGDIYRPDMLSKALQLKTFDSADHMMGKYIKDKDVRQMMSFQTLYIGVSPKKGPSLYNIIPMIEIMYGVWYLKGGMHSMAEGMVKLFTELGGKIHYDSPVEEIVTENKKVKGVMVNNKMEEADYVISNADFPYTMTKLIRDKAVKGKYSDEKINKMDYSCSCLIFYWGMDKKYEEVNTHTFIVSQDLDENLERIFDGRFLDDPSVYLSIPSRGDSEMAPEGKDGFYVLIPVSELGIAQYKYDSETIDKYREIAFRKIERLPGCKNIRNEIVCENIITPENFEKMFNAYRGATFGLQPTLKQSNHLRPQAKSMYCEGLYFTGSSTHPGAGVPIVLQSGKICAEELRRDEPEDSFR